MKRQKRDMLRRIFGRTDRPSYYFGPKPKERKSCSLCGIKHYHKNTCCSAEHYKLWNSGVVWTEQEKKDYQERMRPKVPDMPGEPTAGVEQGMKAVSRYNKDTKEMFMDIYKDGKLLTSSLSVVAGVPNQNGVAYSEEALMKLDGAEYPLLDSEESKMTELQQGMSEPVLSSMSSETLTEESLNEDS